MYSQVEIGVNMVDKRERSMRNQAIDVYRCMLMYGICLLHSITQAGHNVAWAANMLSWCVPGFMFISGWFGMRFSFMKVAKLYGISLYCATVFVIFDAVVSGGGIDFRKIVNVASKQWFLNAYVVVMCFAPMVNVAVEQMAIKHLYPIMLCAFGWSFATTLPVVCKYVPPTHGLTAYSFLTLLGVYIVARFARKCHENNPAFQLLIANRKLIALIVCVCLVCAAIGLNDYNSPFALVIAAGAFLLLLRMKIPTWLSRICIWLGPTMFSVYLMHSHGYAWKYLTAVEEYFLNVGVRLPFAYLLTAMCVFCTCVVWDMPRRVAMCCLIGFRR